MDYDLLLATAQKHHTPAILDLIQWSENYSWSDKSNPLVGFYGLAQIEDFDMQLPVGATYGYVELDLIGKALCEYADNPQNVENFLREVTDLEFE